MFPGQNLWLFVHFYTVSRLLRFQCPFAVDSGHYNWHAADCHQGICRGRMHCGIWRWWSRIVVFIMAVIITMVILLILQIIVGRGQYLSDTSPGNEKFFELKCYKNFSERATCFKIRSQIQLNVTYNTKQELKSNINN